jgi:hypothetical protein
MSQNWIVTADNRRAVLFVCRRLPGGGLHLEELRKIENAHEGEHEHHRPSLFGGAERRGSPGNSSARAAPHSGAPGHQEEAEQRQFAAEVSDWLTRAAKELGMEAGRVSVFAGTRFLGVLRAHMRSVEGKIELREGEFTRLSAPELAGHPAVVNAVA